MDLNNNIDDLCNSPLLKTQSIKEFFDGSNIFVTGSTGFLGKVLIEKLLRSCDGVCKIYILLRSKRGLGSEQRFNEFLKNQVFDRIRDKTPELLTKLVCVPGDINESELGIDATDLTQIKDHVDIVFHVAATVRFNEQLKDAANLNTFGTQRVMELCTQIKNIKSVVHVSTAYSNPFLKNVGEQVYGSSSSKFHQSFMNGVGVLPDDFVDMISKRFKTKHPNTYTLTKSMAEQLVVDYHEKLPICIVRPSIVTAALEEPFKGWVDNVYGITGIMMEIGRGTISSIMCDQKYTVDLIPVDIVCNTMITAAWSNSFTQTNTIPVYNCTSGQINPVTWQHYGELTVKYARKNPSKYVMLYPKFSYRTNRFVHWLYEIFLHFLPALVFDLLMRAQGVKPIMMKIARRFKMAADTGEFFAMHEWNFETNNLKRLIHVARQTQTDSEDFNCDMSNMNWDAYVEQYMLGIRNYVLKDDLSSMDAARLKIKRLYWSKRIFQFVIMFMIYYFFFQGLWF
ncbi:unnamed protein product [Diamesa tonsa]